jgi:hypothetical protein
MVSEPAMSGSLSVAKKAWPLRCVLVETDLGINTVIVVPAGRINIPAGGFRNAGR